MAEALMQRERTSMSPALLVSALLHGGLLAGALVSWPWLSKPADIGPVVPVTIVSNAPVADVRPAVEGPNEMEGMTEDPVPDATPEPVAPPEPVPEPVPPPKPAAKPVPPTPAPKPKPAKKADAPSLDLDALAASIQPKKAAGKPRSSARRGASRPETAVEARPAVGAATGLAANALASLAADLERRWNPNCGVEGGADVDIRMTFRLTNAGYIVDGIDGVTASGPVASNSMVNAAAFRARRAIVEAQPFKGLPPDLYGPKITVKFNARNACGR